MFRESYTRATGDRLRLDVLRGHDTVRADVVVGERADHLDRLRDELDPQKNLVRRLGVLGVSVDGEVGSLLPDLRLPFGVVVLGRAQRTHNSDIPLSTGDVVHAVNGRAVATFADLNTALEALGAQSPVALQVERGSRLLFVSFTLE
jgi:hypothetical protein